MLQDLDKNQSSKFICYRLGVSVSLLEVQVPYTSIMCHVNAGAGRDLCINLARDALGTPRWGEQPLSHVLISMESSQICHSEDP